MDKPKETQLQQVIRKSEAGQFSDDFTIRISRYGFSMTRLGVKKRGVLHACKTLCKHLDIFDDLQKGNHG